jgi:hypothetical protein
MKELNNLPLYNQEREDIQKTLKKSDLMNSRPNPEDNGNTNQNSLKYTNVNNKRK